MLMPPMIAFLMFNLNRLKITFGGALKMARIAAVHNKHVRR